MLQPVTALLDLDHMIYLWGLKLETLKAEAYFDTWYYRSISVGAINEPKFGTQPYSRGRWEKFLAQVL